MEVFRDLTDWSVQPLAGPGWIVRGLSEAWNPMSQSWMRRTALSRAPCPDHQIRFTIEIPSNRDYVSAHSGDSHLLLSPVDGDMASHCSKWCRNYKVTAGLSKKVLFKKKTEKAIKGIVRAGKIAVWEGWETEFKELLVH